MSDDSADSQSPEDEVHESTEEDGSEDAPSEPEADTSEEAEDANDEATEDGVGESDFVTLEVTAYSLDSETLVDTSDPELAEEEGVDTEERTIEPRTVPIGAGHLFPSVESDIIGREVGEGGSVEVPPNEAFGEYNPENVRTVSADKIGEDDRYPGARVEIDSDFGYIETIIGGRARVDFNHPLAGEAIEYEYEIIDVVEDRLEQAQSLLSSVVDVELDMWIETVEEEQEVPVESEEAEEADDEDVETEMETVELEVLYMESVPQLALNQQWMFRKQQIAQEIIDRVGVDRIVVQETIEGMGALAPGLGDLDEMLEDVDAEDIADEVEEVAEADQ